MTATVVGSDAQSAPSSLNVSVTCGVKDNRVSTQVTGTRGGRPAASGTSSGPPAAGVMVRFRVPAVVHQACTVARTVITATGTVHPTAVLDIN